MSTILNVAIVVVVAALVVAWVNTVFVLVEASTGCQRKCVPVMAEDIGKGVICIDRAEEVKP